MGPTGGTHRAECVNEQANTVKARIVKEEQQQTQGKIDSIITQIQQIITNEKLQHLGSETTTKTNVTRNANIGTKATTQGTSNY